MVKKFFREVDSIIFNKKIQHHYAKYLNKKNLENLKKNCEYKIYSFYSKNKECELSKLCDKYGTDKGELITEGHPYPWPSHTYADIYSKLFSHCRESVSKVFECGIGTNNPLMRSSMGVFGKPGASLRVWRDYFPNAIIYGADIDENILFEEHRIKTYIIDQLDSIIIKNYWENIKVIDFNLMIDDGLHTFEGGTTLFENSIHRLKNDGIYIIEDVNLNDMIKYNEYFKNKKYFVEYIYLEKKLVTIANNNLIIIRK